MILLWKLFVLVIFPQLRQADSATDMEIPKKNFKNGCPINEDDMEFFIICDFIHSQVNVATFNYSLAQNK